MSTISVILITQDEEKNIERCLKSVQWANEIIIVDSGSKDKTVEIAEELNAKVYYQSWLGFGLQKAKALSFANCDWILSLDADEVISNDLAEEIQGIINNKNNASYKIRRITQLYGHWIHYGDWRNDCPVRLIPREYAKFSDNVVHESFYATGDLKVELCKGVIKHYAFPTAELMLNKINSYTTAAVVNNKSKKKVSYFKVLFKAHWTFLRSYIFKLGFLDGKAGIMLAISAKEGTYYKYLKIHLSQNKRDDL